jgi:hypothetical protein
MNKFKIGDKVMLDDDEYPEFRYSSGVVVAIRDMDLVQVKFSTGQGAGRVMGYYYYRLVHVNRCPMENVP